jgi:hypothetical protein
MPLGNLLKSSIKEKKLEYIKLFKVKKMSIPLAILSILRGSAFKVL